MHISIIVRHLQRVKGEFDWQYGEEFTQHFRGEMPWLLRKTIHSSSKRFLYVSNRIESIRKTYWYVTDSRNPLIQEKCPHTTISLICSFHHSWPSFHFDDYFEAWKACSTRCGEDDITRLFLSESSGFVGMDERLCRWS